MSDHWTDRLSEYLDGDLAPGERGALEAHLETCAHCRVTLGELQRVVARARALDDTPPARDLWPTIAGRLRVAGEVVDIATRRDAPAVSRRRVSFTWPQLAAAALALMAVSAGAVATVLRGRGASPTPPPMPVALAPAPDAVATAAGWAGSEHYDAAVAELEQVLTQHRAQLDTATVRVLEKNLTIIDRAIGEARAALAADPSNAYLNHHLARTMRRKLELLRRANALVAEPT